MGVVDTFVYGVAAVWMLSWLSYILPQVYIKFLKPQNLKEKYNAECKFTSSSPVVEVSDL